MARSKPFRKERLGERILHELNQALRTEFGDPRLMFVSITKVELTSDLAYCKLYWDTFDNSSRGDVKRSLESISGRLRTHLSKIIELRKVPELTFVYDAQYVAELEIERLIQAAKNTPPEAECNP